MYANVRGMKSKITNLATILDDCKPEVFLLTETQLRSNVGINIAGYSFHGRKREGKIGGGVGILVRNDVRQNVFIHSSTRDIELMWLSVQRAKKSPIIIGTYYGKQLSRTSKQEIQREMNLLEEEITEMKKDGEILICMDGNAKLNLLGEGFCRNGKLLKQVFERTDLSMINRSSKCEGKLTRKNTKDENEVSAIDFVLASQTAEKWISKVIIDEDGLYKIKGKLDSDHNTILINIRIPNIEKFRAKKTTVWNLRAPSEKWADFSDQLRQNCEWAASQISDSSIPLETRYNNWYRGVEQMARQTIGKTTLKATRDIKPTDEMKLLQQRKKALKDEIQNEKDKEEKDKLIADYKSIQEKLTECMVEVRTNAITMKFEKIVNDKSMRLYWDEKRRVNRDLTLESLVVKNEQGERQYNPDAIMETTASYFENLFKKPSVPHHPYHDELKTKINNCMMDTQYDDMEYNQTPSR